jgi:hypothetical protein
MTVLTHSYSALKLYENCPLRYYRQRVLKDVKDKGGEASMYGERIHKLLEERLKGSEEPAPEIKSYQPIIEGIQKIVGDGELLVEQELALNKNLTPTGWWDDDVWMRSKLDVLVLHGEKATMLDWKTGKHRPDFNQLELFALQVFAHYPEVTSVTAGFLWLQDFKMDKETYHKEHLSKLWNSVLSRVHKIEQSLDKEEWPAKPSGLCGWCPCRSTCKFAR